MQPFSRRLRPALGARGVAIVFALVTRGVPAAQQLWTRISDHPINRTEEPLPWNLAASVPPEPTA